MNRIEDGAEIIWERRKEEESDCSEDVTREELQVENTER
jgi:hypothetical protein